MTIKDIARNSAAAEVFSVMASEEKSQATIDQIRSMSDAQLDVMGTLSMVPPSLLSIFRSMVRGEENSFMKSLGEFEDVLKTGDLILVTGKEPSSKALVTSQKPFYWGAKSSHVAVVHADFICIDAMPGPGVSNRLISEILSDVEDQWRVIRFNDLNDAHTEPLQKRCAHYIMQPYKITLKRKRGKDYSYCSELARKVYEDCQIENTGIPQHSIVMPCDFDRIADNNGAWIDITSRVKPYIEFAIEFTPLLKVLSKLFIDGLMLNRSRYEERRQMLKNIERAKQKGRLSPEAADAMAAKIQEINDAMNFTFWDFRKAAATP